MKEKQGILGRISLSNRLSGEETNSKSITRRNKGSKSGACSKSSNKSKNPFGGRGIEKFNEVYSELEAMRAAIAAREGVSTSDVWFTRSTTKDKDWVPVVVGRPSSRVSSPERVFLPPEEESTASSRSLEEPSAAAVALDKGVGEQSPSRLTPKAEQIIYDLQQGARRALKAVTLFVMIVAAVADVLVALVAGLASSFVAKHLRSFWARFLPLNFMNHRRSDREFEFPVPLPPPVAMFPCSSCPTSPRQQQQQEVESLKASIKSTTSASTPVSPVRPLPTFFNNRRGQHQSAAEQPASLAKQQQQQQQQQQQRIDRNNKHNVIQRESNFSQQQLSDGTPIMLIVLVILFSLSVGRLTAALLASMAWFLFPIFKTFAGRGAAAHGALRKQRSFTTRQ